MKGWMNKNKTFYSDNKNKEKSNFERNSLNLLPYLERNIVTQHY